MRMTLNRLVEIIAEAVDDQDGGDQAGDMALSRAERTAKWQSRRPNIGHLQPGTTESDGDIIPLFHVGDRIVVDRKASQIAGNPWLDTLVGRVKKINDSTGVVEIVDEESDPRAPRRRYVNYKDGMHQIKLAPAEGDPFEVPDPRAVPGATPAAPAAKAAPKQTYRIYGKLGQHAVHTRLKGQAYYAPQDTKFKSGDQARIEPKDGKLRVRGADSDHEQLWEPET